MSSLVSGILAACVLAWAWTGSAHALSFTGKAAFQAEVANLGLVSGTVDFDSIPDGSVVSGQTLVASNGIGITLPASIPDPFGGPDLDLEVVVEPISGNHFLGASDLANFDTLIAGTSIALAFATPVQAFGLTLFSAETPGVVLLDGDLELVVLGEAAATLDTASGQVVAALSLPGGGTQDVYAYFLGVTSLTPFTSATLLTPSGVGAEGTFFYLVDDFEVAHVPEPGTLPLLSGGLGALALRRRRRSLAAARAGQGRVTR